MFKKFTNGCVQIVNRWLPDPFLFAIVLSIIVYFAAMIVTSMGPFEILNAWGSSTGFWNLLAFSMQMALVLVLGSAMASAKVFKNALNVVAGLAKDNCSAIIITTFFSAICCWLNWGFGLIAGALLAKAVARRVATVDYRLLIASAYSGFVIWHSGLSGSVPLTLSQGYTIGDITYQAGTRNTIFHPVNLIMCAIVIIAMPFINYAMHPTKENTICVNPKLLIDPPEKQYSIDTPAEKLEHSKILWAITCSAGFGYIIYYFFTIVQAGGSIANSLTLNIVNFIFLFLGLLMHGNLRKYVDAIGQASSSASGILLQFPFYAGIMGMMIVTNNAGISLAVQISNFFVNISNNITFPMLTFLSAGIVNFFVPSGGGQWAVQGPIVMPAAAQLGVEAGRAAMAIAWGDQWTNMIQPFWALPALGIAGLKAKDIMGYLVIILFFTGLLACAGFFVWSMF
ncbi:MAG: short-chain fatty acid transporter [Lachnospiraceae bacterium]